MLVSRQTGLEQFKKLEMQILKNKITTTHIQRKYAAAQAGLTDSSLVIPIQSNGGSPLVVEGSSFTKPLYSPGFGIKVMFTSLSTEKFK